MVLKSIKKYVLIHQNELKKGTRTMENTEETEINVEDVGTILKSGRLKSKKSLEDISSELCIRKIYLTALEEGDYETLPPIPYGVGYVRTYARYLGLSPERVVKLYKAAFQTEETVQEEEKAPEPEANKSNKWHIIIGILALALIYSMWSLYSSRTEDVVIADTTEEAMMDASEAEEDTEENMTTENTEESESTESEEKIKEHKADGIEEEKDNKEEKTENINVPEKGIYMTFTGETWVEVKDKNKVYVQRVFHAGDERTLDYMKNLFISVGRPQNIKLYIDGVEKDVVAKKRKSNIPLDSI